MPPDRPRRRPTLYLTDVATIVLAVASLLLVVSVVQPLAGRFALPTSVLLALVGTTIGAAASFVLNSPTITAFDAVARPFAAPPVTAAVFLDCFLPILLFQAAVTMDIRRLLEDAVPILLLAVLAVLVTTGLIGWSVSMVSGEALIPALLLGSIVATTDPAAVVAIFRDLGAPARLTRLVEGESLLNDAAAISIFTILVSLLKSGGAVAVGPAIGHFVLSFGGGILLGVAAGRLATSLLPLFHGDRAAEMTLTLALPYLVFIVGEDELHISGVVGVVAAGVTFGSTGLSRISPFNWAFLNELWEQLAFWAGSFIFILAAILVPTLLVDVGVRDLLLMVTALAAAMVARMVVLWGVLPPLTWLKWSAPVSTPYKLVITWGGLRGAVTVALALAVTEDPGLPETVKRFVAVLATGFVLFTLLVNGTTLRAVIRVLKLDQLSPRDEALRDSIVALSLVDLRDSLAATAVDYRMSEPAAAETLARYTRRIEAATRRRDDHAATLDAERPEMLERDRLAVALVALASHERRLVLDHHAQGTASRRVIERLLHGADVMADAARTDGRSGYVKAVKKIARYTIGFRFAHFLHRRLGIETPLARRLAERLEQLLVTRMLLDELVRFISQKLTRFADERLLQIVRDIVDNRHDRAQRMLGALQAQYPEYSVALERRILDQAALRQEQQAYRGLYEEGLIGQELYEDLSRRLRKRQAAVEVRPHLDLSLKPGELMRRIDMFRDLAPEQAERLGKLARPLIAVPGEKLVRKGDRGDSVYFISSGAVEVILPGSPVTLGRGDIFGEMALLTGEPRRADVVAATYSQLLVLHASDFRRFLGANPDIRAAVQRILDSRLTADAQRSGPVLRVS
ncbi:sodium:proton antiporter [Aliidongia dinghuensis]|uniref:Sodium:proton antiporter n=1 Tax=Aliidongia dinghuensis TaxID=1867774 RepID=A0A8J2YUX6_9PROT|nr:cation:proton antiporter [Aliidongia dinghuensis]GGF21356.1 sodium:proton antiporter [Aliidongia dinghuensis]